MTIVTSRFPPMPLDKRDTQNEEIAFADIPQTISGNCANHHGLTVGGDSVGTNGETNNPTPINPSGDLGHDHSGGVWARPLKKTIASINMETGQFNSSKYGFDATNDIIGSSAFLTGGGNIAPVRLEPDPGLPGETVRSTDPRTFFVWVPPCEPSAERGVYHVKCGVQLTFTFNPISFQTSVPLWWGGPGLQDDVFINVINNHRSIGSVASRAARIGPIDGPFNEEILVLDTDTINLIPGDINPLKFEVEIQLNGAAVPVDYRSCEINILDVEIGVEDTSSS